MGVGTTWSPLPSTAVRLPPFRYSDRDPDRERQRIVSRLPSSPPFHVASERTPRNLLNSSTDWHYVTLCFCLRSFSFLVLPLLLHIPRQTPLLVLHVRRIARSFHDFFRMLISFSRVLHFCPHNYSCSATSSDFSFELLLLLCVQ